MSEMTDGQAMREHGRLKRLFSSVGSKLLRWVSRWEWGMSPAETRMFMIYTGFGWDEIMGYELLVSVDEYEDVEASDAS